MFLLKVHQAKSVMQNAVAAEIIAVGATSDEDDRNILGIGSGNGIGNAQAAHHESHNHSRHTICTSIAICRISCSARISPPQRWLEHTSIHQMHSVFVEV